MIHRLGMGPVIQEPVLAVQNTAGPRKIGVATSGNALFRVLGGVFAGRCGGAA